jgi:flagellar motor switch protein FliN/FliY
VNSVSSVSIEIAVVLGTASMPIHQLLRMGRGAVIELQTENEDQVMILANNRAVARGDVVVQNEKIAVEITEILKRAESER